MLVNVDEQLDKDIAMSNTNIKHINGTVRYLQRRALGANSTLHVSLLDVTVIDAPKQIAAQTTPHAETAGLHFDLAYNMADVLPEHRYAISATIKTNDQAVFTTNEHHYVELGVDHLQPQDILVRSV